MSQYLVTLLQNGSLWVTLTLGTAYTTGIVERVDFTLVTCYTGNVGPTLALTRHVMTFIVLGSQSSTVAL